MARIKAKNGERSVYVGCKISDARAAKLKDMSVYGGQSVYQIACRALENYIDTQDVPGYPKVDIPEECLDEPCCELYCPDLGEEKE